MSIENYDDEFKNYDKNTGFNIELLRLHIMKIQELKKKKAEEGRLSYEEIIQFNLSRSIISTLTQVWPALRRKFGYKYIEPTEGGSDPIHRTLDAYGIDGFLYAGQSLLDRHGYANRVTGSETKRHDIGVHLRLGRFRQDDRIQINTEFRNIIDLAQDLRPKYLITSYCRKYESFGWGRRVAAARLIDDLQSTEIRVGMKSLFDEISELLGRETGNYLHGKKVWIEKITKVFAANGRYAVLDREALWLCVQGNMIEDF